MTNRIALFTLILVALIGFTACGGDDTSPNPTPDGSVATTDGLPTPTADAGDPSLPDCKVDVADLHAFLYDVTYGTMLDVFNRKKPVAVDSTLTVTVSNSKGQMTKAGKPDNEGFFTIHMKNAPTWVGDTLTLTVAGPSCKPLNVSLKVEWLKFL